MRRHNGMRPQDIVVLFALEVDCQDRQGHIPSFGSFTVLARPLLVKKDIATKLRISASEVTESLARSAYAGLYDPHNQQVMRRALLEFLQYGIRYVFPQQPGAVVRGIPTAHSAKPLVDLIVSDEQYVWPDANGTVRGQAIEPLYPSVTEAIQDDSRLYEMLALTDAIRIGRSREVAIAVEELRKRFDISE